jgi:2-iminobutanoate/2-iminopropanoate deaminase
MERVERIFPDNIPKAVGPYSPVTAVGDLLFISGQIPINPQTNEVDQKDIEWQTHQVMKNLKSAVEGADSCMNNIAKCTILLTDMNNFAKVNEIYGQYFEGPKVPARACFAVLALPKAVLVEIEAVAVRNSVGDSLKKKVKVE